MPHIPTAEIIQAPPELLHVEEAAIGRTVLRAMHGGAIDLNGMEAGRHYIAAANLEDRQHLIRVTVPERSDDDGHGIMMFPGFTEAVDYGTGRALHDAVARRFPRSRVVSVATDGVSLRANPLGSLGDLGRNFDAMAADRLGIARALMPDRQVTTVSVSMGTIIGLKLALMNLRADPGQRVDLRHAIYHSHAQMPPNRVLPDVGRFLLHMSIQNWTEGPRYPRVMLEQTIASLACIGAHVPAYAGNIWNMAHGTSRDDMHRAAAAVPTTYISGVADPLAQPELLHELQTAYPQNVRVIWRPGLGHAATLNADREAAHIAAAHSARSV